MLLPNDIVSETDNAHVERLRQWACHFSREPVGHEDVNVRSIDAMEEIAKIIFVRCPLVLCPFVPGQVR
jgi:hypothetical protein